MARPGPTILHTAEVDDGTIWDILQAPGNYIITYQGQVCGVRHHVHTLTSHGFRYQKLSYNNLGNARAQVRRLNTKFNCLDFDVKEIS